MSYVCIINNCIYVSLSYFNYHVHSAECFFLVSAESAPMVREIAAWLLPGSLGHKSWRIHDKSQTRPVLDWYSYLYIYDIDPRRKTTPTDRSIRQSHGRRVWESQSPLGDLTPSVWLGDLTNAASFRVGSFSSTDDLWCNTLDQQRLKNPSSTIPYRYPSRVL